MALVKQKSRAATAQCSDRKALIGRCPAPPGRPPSLVVWNHRRKSTAYSRPPSSTVNSIAPSRRSSRAVTVTQCQSSRSSTSPLWRLSQATGRSAERAERRKAAHWSAVGRARRSRGMSSSRMGRSTPFPAAKALHPLGEETGGVHPPLAGGDAGPHLLHQPQDVPALPAAGGVERGAGRTGLGQIAGHHAGGGGTAAGLALPLVGEPRAGRPPAKSARTG